MRGFRVFGGARDEARQAVVQAERLVASAETQAVEMAALAERIKEHGRRNHFGERIYAAMRRA